MNADFNKKETLDNIVKLMKKEKDAKVYKKLSFLRNRAMGYSVEESSKRSFIAKSYGYKIQDEWADGEYEGLLGAERKEGSGRKSKLNKRQLKQLSKILKTENDLTIPKIQTIIKDNWNIQYTYTGVKNLLKGQLNEDVSKYIDYTPKTNKTKASHTPEDNKPDFTEKELNTIIKRIHDEKDVFVYRKLLSFLLQKLGHSLEDISKIIGITTETLLTWNKQWNEGGYESLLKKTGQGRKSKLNDEEWAEIKKIMKNRNDWTLPEIAYVIETKYGVKYSPQHLSQLLKKN